MSTAGSYQIFVKTKTTKPRAVAVNVKGRRTAISKAKSYFGRNPRKTVGVYTLHRVRVFKPKKAKR